MDEPGHDHKKRISRKSNLHSRFEAKKSGAGAVMKIPMKTPNVPLVPFLLSSISLSSSSLSTLETQFLCTQTTLCLSAVSLLYLIHYHSKCVSRPRSSWLAPSLPSAYSPIPQLAAPSSITARVTPRPASMSSTLFGTPIPYSCLTTHP